MKIFITGGLGFIGSNYILSKINDSSIKPMVRQILPLEKAAEAHSLMESATHLGKIMLKVN